MALEEKKKAVEIARMLDMEHTVGTFLALQDLSGVEKVRVNVPRSVSVSKAIFTAMRKLPRVEAKGDTLKVSGWTVYGKRQ